MSFPRYERYRDSGLEWLGEVPERWQCRKLHHVAILNPAKAELGNTDPQTAISFLPMEAFDAKRDPSLALERTVGEVETGYTYFRDDDVAFAKVTPCFENGKRAVFKGLKNGVGFGTTELIVLRARSRQAFPKFLYWFVATTQFLRLGEGSMYGAGGLKRIPDLFVHQFPICLPDIAEQISIAAFLDCETAKIDMLIDEQQRLIELLKEKRQTVISHAVTKGLDPNAAMTHTQIEWIRTTPRHWQVLQLGRLCTGVSDGPHFSPNYVEDGIPFLSARNIKVDSWSLGDVKYISEEDCAVFDRRVVPSVGDVLYTKGGTTGIARAVDLDLRFQVWVHIAVLKLRTDLVHAAFLAFALNSTGCYEQSQLFTRGATNNDLGLTRMIKIWLVLPPLDEQREICCELNKALSSIDLLIGSAMNATSLLEERRSALISAAVTGKIDVRNYAPKEAA